MVRDLAEGDVESEEGLSTVAESVVDEVVDDVVVVGVLADRSPSGVPCGMVLPGSKKMNWWMESSWLKPSSRLVRIVTAPV